ncbi:MAG: tRNA (guanosine(37)-N1)-methyltransferase TrmD [Chloroflexi bacterium]|nr:tRNA (guanosine(37)-N1)-methyltransferase TrmD [Chloroflexota bacterium]
MRIDVLTLFPEMFPGVMNTSMMWKAQEYGFLDLHVHQLRDWTTDRHRTIDDTPYGGGGGMVMRADIVVRAVEAVQSMGEPGPVYGMSPQGQLFSNDWALRLSKLERLILVCGHYEGIDDRARQIAFSGELSIGDYVLTGGELAAMVIIDAVVRQIPGVLGSEGGAERESLSEGFLEGAHYTRPVEFRGLTVPEVLQAGNHGAIVRWRRENGLRRTWDNRPDLLRRAHLTDEDKRLLARFAMEDAIRLAEKEHQETAKN